MVQYFTKPGKDLKLFEPTEKKINSLADKFYIGWLWLPDELRDKNGILGTINYLFPNLTGTNQGSHVYYEMGDFQGLLGFCNILPDHKCDLFFRIWDKAFWGPTVGRDLRMLVMCFMRGWGLRRISFQTPDIKSKRLAEFLGFQVEGTQKLGFKFDGKYLTNFLFRKLA